MDTLYELVQAPLLATYWQEEQSNRVPYFGELIFPSAKKLGLDLSWIKGKGQLPVMLRPSYFDALATVRDRIGVQELTNEMPFFREGMTLNEKERQELLKIQEANMQYYRDVVLRIFDDRTTLVNGALVVPERMRMELLLNATITIEDNEVSYVYDYDVDGTWRTDNYLELTGTSMWSDTANSKPYDDLNDMMDEIEEKTGTRPTRILMTRNTLNYLIANESFRLDVNPLGGQNVIPTEAWLRQYISSKLGLQIAVYNKKYGLHDGTTHQFYPDNYVTLLPPGAVGKTWYGTTPEEADLMAGATDAQVSVVNTGVAVTTYKIKHPVNVKTLVSQIVLPSFEEMDKVATIKVAA